jgi:transcriptional regulator with XRE-family HTH domain
MQTITQQLLDHIYAEAARKGLSKAELASQAGLLPTVMSRAYRRGVMNIDSLEKLAAVCGLTLSLIPKQRQLAKKLNEGSLF